MDRLSITALYSRLGEFTRVLSDVVGRQNWLAIFVVLFTTLIVERLVLFVFKKFGHLAGKTGTALDDLIIEKSSRPVGNYVLMFGLFLILHILQLPTHPLDGRRVGLLVVKIVVVVNTLWLLWRLTDVLGAYLFAKVVRTSSRLDDQIVPLLQKTTKIFILIVGSIYVIQSLGYSVSGVVAGLGIGGLAVAMAARDTLANFFGSVMILADRPFKVGDWVGIGDDEGVVEQIGFRSTRIRTFPKTQISIPNSIIANASVNNYSRMPKRRVKMVVGVTYDTSADQMQALLSTIRNLLREHPEIDQEFQLVNFTDFGASSLDILVYYFTKQIDWPRHLALREDINLSIMRTVEAMDLSIAFPTRTVHLVGGGSHGSDAPGAPACEPGDL